MMSGEGGDDAVGSSGGELPWSGTFSRSDGSEDGISSGDRFPSLFKVTAVEKVGGRGRDRGIVGIGKRL